MQYVKPKDIELAKRIICEELDLVLSEENEVEIMNKVEDVLNTVYSIGGGYIDYTIREVVKSLKASGYM